MVRKGKKLRIFSALEVANICGVVNQTAINWIKSSHLKAFTTPGGQYRVYADDLRAFLESRGMRIPDEIIDLTEESVVNVLVVDDDREVNNLIREYVKRKLPQLTVLQAFDGFEAGKLLSENHIKVIILDIDLPGVDGYSLCRRIKEDANLDQPAVISISGLGDEDLEGRILADGADRHFPKPLEMEELLEAILDFASGRR